jgi:hypothetical protein
MTVSYPQNPPPQQPPYDSPQPQYGAPQQPYGAPQQPYGAPQQPQYGAPAQPGGLPVPPPPVAKKKSKAGLIVLIVIVLGLIGLGIVGYAASRNDAQNAKVGDCLVGQSDSTIKKVDCSKPHDWTVVGEFKNKSESDASGDACHAAFATAEAAFWWGEAGKKGDVLCLAPVNPS